MAIRAGSWGTPELGITERIQSLFSPSSSRTIQGGSNLLQRGASPQQQYSSPIGPQPSPGSVLGISSAGQQYPGAIGPQPQARSTGGGGSAGGGGAPTGNISSGIMSGQFDQQAPAFSMPDYDAMINPALQALDAAINPAQQQFQESQGIIESSRQRGVAANQSALEQAQKSAELSKTRNTQSAEGAVNEQRRGLSEIQQGLQARYGGTTGTGGFATEIAGSTALRNIGGIRQNLSNTIQGIDDKLEQVRTATTLAIQDVEDKAREATLGAKSQLENTLNQIRMAKGELQSRKAELAANAVQMYQQTLAQINASNSQYKQQFALQLANAEQQLSAARERGVSAKQQFELFTTATGDTVRLNPYTGEVAPVDTTGGLYRFNPEEEQDSFID